MRRRRTGVLQQQVDVLVWSGELGSTWSSSRGDIERLGGVDGDGLVGVVVRVVGEHLPEQTMLDQNRA